MLPIIGFCLLALVAGIFIGARLQEWWRHRIWSAELDNKLTLAREVGLQ